ncbi:hydrogenase 4 subunit B [Methylovirgula sp. HY1]|uniref:hydrogenase 4 subunit B n=1 Tax=Methylovirgula sp. HY1 TaxID=2822761 RepID=UPI001C5AF33E|nr:hydrogenase 4 subunit B [Methylovirgula sp. HY1]QXX76551.1 Hydrogenase-4 component B [Methylovirgula sp. HY1]
MPIVLLCISGLLVVSALPLILVRRRAATPVVYGACLMISLTVCAVSLLSIGQASSEAVLPLGLPWLGAHFRLDPLASAFLAIVNFGGASASLYALGYGRHEQEPGRVLPFYPVFLAAMNLVIIAADAYSFLFAWELMSLASWALVMARHRAAKTAYAGYVYLIMASFGTFALLFAFGLLAGGHGDYAFDAIRARHLSPGLAGFVLVLAVAGAGSKAGLAPLHVWLPLAHPAAPSHVSALMSGVMTKVAIYAFIRIAFDLMGDPSWWWSLPALLLGGATAAIGVLYALMETDLKRVLAYSTIENIGIIFIAIGLALAFKANGLAGAAALALTAALFHALNHMLFKSALFFGAGTVIVATGEHDMERLGGLIRRMPVSSAAFLAVSMAISALPPFNGFASEWLIFQSILVSPQLPQMGLKLLVPAVGVLLALAAAFAAACFVRAFGATYLGRARTSAATQAVEADRWSLAAMLICAALCLLAGAFPGIVIDWLQPATGTLVAGRMPSQASIPWLSIVPISASRSSYNGLLLFGFVAASASLAAIVVHRFASRMVRKAPFWDCGYPGLDAVAQYSATSLAQPIRRVFGAIAFAAHEQVEMPPPGDPRPAILQRFLRDPVWDFMYAPVASAIGASATLLNYIQFFTIRRYLSFVFIALIVLLVVLALWG